MSGTNEVSHHVPFTSDSSLAAGLHISAALGGGVPHAFLLDTGSVGILVPRTILGPDHQQFDSSHDKMFQYVSSGKTYHGQWVKVPVVLGVPADWDGTGDHPIADVEVFAVDQPAGWDGGMFGVGFAIGKHADGGPARNPLLHASYRGVPLNDGYIVSARGIDVGLTPLNTQGFSFIALDRKKSGKDWLQPVGSYSLSGVITTQAIDGELPILMDTGIGEMIVWLGADDIKPEVSPGVAFPAGVSVSISAPPADSGEAPALRYAFVTGDAGQPMAPTQVTWRAGKGINTGRNVLAGADYLYDATAGRVGFRIPPGIST
jgi:hypothetical protein